MTRIRVLIVEDSITVRRHLTEVVASDPGFEVVGDVGDGKAAIEACRALRPDVITLDMMLPVMTGLAATEYIMAYCPTPILIVSASTNRGELFRTYEALAAGALDVLEKPRGDEMDEAWKTQFLSTLRLVSRIRVITHPRGRLGTPRFTPSPADADPRGATSCRLVAIGASTGGPAALAKILHALPRGYPLPILLVIHLAAAFATALAEWLDSHSSLRVTFARDGEPLPPVGCGRVIMAPPDRHLVVRNGRLCLTSDPERNSCRPSVDALFESLAREMGSEVAACLLTGIGRDGAEGLLATRRAGGMTFAQDEASSVVYGMPREAVLRGAAQRVLSLDEFAPTLTALAPAGTRRV